MQIKQFSVFAGKAVLHKKGCNEKYYSSHIWFDAKAETSLCNMQPGKQH